MRQVCASLQNISIIFVVYCKQNTIKIWLNNCHIENLKHILADKSQITQIRDRDELDYPD